MSSLGKVTENNVNIFNKHYCKVNNNSYKDLFPIERVIVETLFPKTPARILDIGCGWGRTTHELDKLGYEVIGIDLAGESLKEAHKYVPNAKFYQMDACETNFEDNYFDAVLFPSNGLDCIYPNSQRGNCLQEIHRILKPGCIAYYGGHCWLGAFGRLSNKGKKEQLKSFLKILFSQVVNAKLFQGYWAYPNNLLLYGGTPLAHLNLQIRNSLYPIAVLGSQTYSGREFGFLSDDQFKHPITSELNKYSDIPRLKHLQFSWKYHHIHYIMRSK